MNDLVTTHAGQTYERDYVIDYTSPENDDLYVYALGNGQTFAEPQYDATNRTWMAMDSIQDGLNLYQHRLSNPTTNWDPTGLFVAELATLAAANLYALAALIIAGGTFALLPQEVKDQINAGITNALSNAVRAADGYFFSYSGCQTEYAENHSPLPQQGKVEGDVDRAPSVDAGKQGKHVEGHPNYYSGRST